MTVPGSAQPDKQFPPPAEGAAETGASAVGSSGNAKFEGKELDAALQLLVERAQYITGATGAALALSQGDEMVCRASAGSSSPTVGARLQVRSGLSGESIARRQLLRCDNAETDPRVNLETCRQLGIASIVVLPLLSRTGEVRGIFELFSDHAHAFEERDLVALERMADLTLTAIDLAERRPAPATPAIMDQALATNAVVIPPAPPNVAASSINATLATSPIPLADQDEPAISPQNDSLKTTDLPDRALNQPLGAAQVHSALFRDFPPEPQPAPIPDAMRRVQKCTSCGFPVSEGRTLCVDCENKRHFQPETAADAPAEPVPAFLDSTALAKQSWLSANYVNVLAAVVLVLSIVVAVVVFR